jgi:16S rRNA (adenine1518-N6/adenine1519-N6)-dimethyltransferase
MVQKELAGRLTATAGNKDWSPLSVFTQMLFDVEFNFDVSPVHFHPRPQVTSSVVTLRPRSSVDLPHSSEFASLVRASFRQRRTLLVNNLVPDIVPDSELARQLLVEAGLEPGCRAEQVTADQFLSLTDCLRRHKLV